MKANELRIGNWCYDILHFKGFFQVAEIGDGFVLSEDYRIPIKEVAGIEITEEWIFKLGFEYDNNSETFEKDIIDLQETANGYQLLFDKYHPFGIKIIYVHELQNLYFALTGKELILA